MGKVITVPTDEVAELSRFDFSIARKFSEPETWKDLTLPQHAALLVLMLQNRGLTEKYTPYVSVTEKPKGRFVLTTVSRDGRVDIDESGAEDVIRTLFKKVLGEVQDKYKSATLRDTGIGQWSLTKVSPADPVPPSPVPDASEVGQ